MGKNFYHWIPIALVTLTEFSCKNEVAKIHKNGDTPKVIDAREYEGLTYKDAIYHFVTSMSKPDLVGDHPEGLAHFVLIAPEDRAITKVGAALKRPQYDKATLINEIAMDANLYAGITDNKLVISPSNLATIRESYADAERLPAAANLKSCKLAAMDADELRLNDAILYLNEKINFSGISLTINLDDAYKENLISMYYKNTTAFDIIVLIAAANGLVCEQADEKSLALKKNK